MNVVLQSLKHSKIIGFTHSASAYKALERSNLMAFCVGGDSIDAESN